VVKNTLSKAAGDLVQTQAGNEGKGKSLEEKRKKLEVVRKKLTQAKQRLENEKVELMTLEERSSELARFQGENEVGLIDGACHVIGCRLTQELRVQKACDDVASTVHQSVTDSD